MRKICVVVALAFAGCSDSGDTDQDYTPLSLTPQGDHFVANGVIDGTTPKMLREAFAAHPGIKKIVLQFVPGSVDDEANLQASRLLRASGFMTVVPAGGLVASGGTDMFLAGATRNVNSGACVGVHSWAAGNGTEGKDLPREDAQHQLYLGYYQEMGIVPEFYWFTLQEADAQVMHYMSNAGITQFTVATSSVAGNQEASKARCEAIGAAASRSNPRGI